MREKILYFVDFPLNFGGANKVLLTQANIIQQKGYHVLVVIPNDQNGEHVAGYDQICEMYKLRTETAYYTVATCMEQIAIIDVIENYDTVKHIIEEYKPDLIHSAQLNITVELAARELGIPHLMSIYQTDINEFMIDWENIYPQYHMADSLLFSERWGKGLEIPSRCIRVAYEKKDNLNKKYNWENGALLNIISIGALYERKNQLEILKFIQMCKENGQNVQLTILGTYDTFYGQECIEFVEKNEIQNDVIFAGFTLNIEEYLQKADLFILASTVESYPGVLVESMANRVPIISTPIAGVPELLKNEENGFLTEGYEAADIYKSFFKYQQYREHGKLSQIVENAYRTYLENHTYSVVGEQLEDYYQWIIEDYHRKKSSFLKIENIRQIFDQYISEKKLDMTEEEIRRSIWFLYHVFSLLKKKDNKKIAIWGAGMWGGIVLDWLCLLEDDEAEITGFIDMQKNGKYLGYPIIPERDNAIEECGTIFVAVANEKDRLEIISYLDGRGKVRNKDYFMALNDPIRICGVV